MKTSIKIKIFECRDLPAVDRNGLSDPYVCLKTNELLLQTKVIPKTLNPVYNQGFIVSISPATLRDHLIVSVWDKNAIQKNVFIGSVEFHYADILKNLEDFESELNQPQWFGLTNQKKNDQACGDILIKIGFLGYMDSNLKQVVNSFEVSHNAALLSSDDPMDGIYFNHFAFGGIDQTTETETTETAASSKRLSTDSATSSTDSLESRMELLSTKDGVEQPVLVGLLLIKVAGAQNLPLEKSKLKKFNCDPFCVIQFGKKIFRTNLIRHSLNPQWNEAVSFHLKKSDISNDWPINWSIYDFERFKKNNQICQINTSLSQIISKCASPLRNPHKPTAYTPVELEFELEVLNQRTVTLGSTPILKIECTFITYTEIRRNFWMALLSQYTSSLPTEVVPMIDKVSFVTMLDAIESNISDEHVNNMFAMLKKSPQEEITFSEAVEILENATAESLNKQLHPIGIETERLMEIKMCPICEKRLQNRGDYDVVTHLALCSHAMGGFLTQESASSKWVTKIFSYVTFGGLGIGKNSGHILYQDRESGQLLKEKIPSYIRLGIRLLYQTAGSKSAVESRAIKKLLKNMRIKFDSPKSVSYISQFISYHDLDLDQVLDPINSFKTFNEFFYRKLKAGSRILASPSPTVAVCPADSRSNCFETVKSATDLWIKGTKFSVESLLDDKEQAEIFKDGSIAVFRLAPQDYHRFHIPVDGKVVSTKHIDGSYFTVNPMAVRASVDVFVENVRSVTMIDSVFHGRVAYVCIGAMLVGSIVITTQPGQEVKRMDEHGYFKFGGSTIVLLFESGKIAFDKDLVDNSNTSLETLVKMGNSLGAAQK